MEINDFKTFEEFKLFLKTHKDKIPFWSDEQISKFNQKVYELQEKSPEFKEKYTKWVAHLELKEKAKSVKIKISGTKEEEMYSKGFLKLKKIKDDKHKKNKKSPKFLPQRQIEI